jgi:hypothetical protein
MTKPIFSGVNFSTDYSYYPQLIEFEGTTGKIYFASPELGSRILPGLDYNDDGVVDLLLSAPGDEPKHEHITYGAKYVLSGVDGTILDRFAGWNIPAQNGTTQEFDTASIWLEDDAVVMTGDLTGDGIPDILASLPDYDGSGLLNSGAIYLLKGVDPNTPTAPEERSSLFATGTVNQGRLGETLTVLGDVNGDGVDDIAASQAIASPSFGQDRQSVVVFSGRTGDMLYEVTGAEDRFGRFGDVISRLGDLNGDGTNDFAVANPLEAEGAVYVFSGHTGDQLAKITPTTDLFDRLNVEFGSEIVDLGDVTNDGVSDFAVFTPGLASFNAPNAPVGQITFYSGSDFLQFSQIAGYQVPYLSAFGPGTYNRNITGNLQAVGDLDGDGLTELMVEVTAIEGTRSAGFGASTQLISSRGWNWLGGVADAAEGSFWSFTALNNAQNGQSTLVSRIGHTQGHFSAGSDTSGIQQGDIALSSRFDEVASFTRGAQAVNLLKYASVLDAESAALGDYGGVSITVHRKGGADPLDIFSLRGIAFGTLSVTENGSVLRPIGNTRDKIAEVVTTPGQITINFTNIDTAPSHAHVASALRMISYSHAGATTDQSEIILEWSVSDSTGISHKEQLVQLQGFDAPLPLITATGRFLDPWNFQETPEYDEPSLAEERTTFLQYTIELSEPALTDIVVDYDLLGGDGTTLSADDFLSSTNGTRAVPEDLRGQVTIVAGQTSAQLPLYYLAGDGLSEGDEVLNPHIRLSASDPALVNLGDISIAPLVIRDADSNPGGGNSQEPEIIVTIAASGSVSEGHFPDGTPLADLQKVGYSITLSQAATADLQISYDLLAGATSPDRVDAEDIRSATTGTLTIPAGELTAFVPVYISGDQLVEPEEELKPVFSVSSSGMQVATRVIQPASVQIENDDGAAGGGGTSAAIVSLFAPEDAVEGDVSLTNHSFRVVLDQVQAVPVTVDWNIAGQIDISDLAPGQSLSGQIIIPAGAREAEIPVSIKGDTRVELDEALTMTITRATAEGVTIALASSTAQIQILNDDSAEVRIADTSVLEGNLTGTNGIRLLDVDLSLSRPAETEVSLQYDLIFDGGADANDFAPGQATSGTVTFDAGETRKAITLAVQGDIQIEPDESATIRLSNLESMGQDISIADDTGIVTLRNDDAFGVRITTFDVAQAEGTGTGNSASFTLELGALDAGGGAKIADQDVLIDWRIVLVGSNGHSATPDDFAPGTALSGTAIVPAGQQSVDVTFDFAGDSIGERDEGFTFLVSDARTASGGDVPVLGRLSAQGEILDDDAAIVTVDARRVVQTEGRDVVFDFHRSGDLSERIRVDWVLEEQTGPAVRVPLFYEWSDPGDQLRFFEYYVEGGNLYVRDIDPFYTFGGLQEFDEATTFVASNTLQDSDRHEAFKAYFHKVFASAADIPAGENDLGSEIFDGLEHGYELAAIELDATSIIEAGPFTADLRADLEFGTYLDFDNVSAGSAQVAHYYDAELITPLVVQPGEFFDIEVVKKGGESTTLDLGGLSFESMDVVAFLEVLGPTGLADFGISLPNNEPFAGLSEPFLLQPDGTRHEVALATLEKDGASVTVQSIADRLGADISSAPDISLVLTPPEDDIVRGAAPLVAKAEDVDKILTLQTSALEWIPYVNALSELNKEFTLDDLVNQVRKRNKDGSEEIKDLDTSPLGEASLKVTTLDWTLDIGLGLKVSGTFDVTESIPEYLVEIDGAIATSAADLGFQPLVSTEGQSDFTFVANDGVETLNGKVRIRQSGNLNLTYSIEPTIVSSWTLLKVEAEAKFGALFEALGLDPETDLPSIKEDFALLPETMDIAAADVGPVLFERNHEVTFREVTRDFQLSVFDTDEMAMSGTFYFDADDASGSVSITDHIESFATISDGVAEPTVTAIMNIVSATTESGSHVEIENGFATTDILDDDTDNDIIPLTLGDPDIPVRAFFPELAFENLSDKDYQRVFDHYYGDRVNPQFDALFDLSLSLLFYAKSEPTIWGDPRIATLDGATYDFRMTGEFVLARSTDEALSQPFEVQARYTAIGASSVATQTTALAAQIGNARISIDLQRDDLLWIDGKAVDVLPYQVVELSGGFLITGNGTYRFSSILGDELTVHFRDGYLDVDIAVSELRAGNMQGLLGNFDGDALNDLQRADGTELGINPDFSALYGGFADDWRVTNSDTLFDYPTGQTVGSFDQGLPKALPQIDDLPPDVIAWATKIVDGYGITNDALRADAILDVALTGNPDFALSAYYAQPSWTDETQTVTTQNAPDFGSAFGIASVVDTITESLAASTGVLFRVYRMGDLSADLSVSYLAQGAALDPAQPMAGQVNFSAGQSEALITLRTLDDDIAEEAKTVTVTLSNPGGSAWIAAPSAKIALTNDDGAVPVELDVTLLDQTPSEERPLIRVLVERQGDVSSTLEATVTPVAGTAELADLKISEPVKLQFAPGQTEQIASFELVNDQIVETAEDLEFIVTWPDGSETVSVTIMASDKAPDASDDVFGTAQGQSAVLDVLANDVAGTALIDPTSVVIDAQPTAGQVHILADGTIRFTPDTNQVGRAQFSYSVADTTGNRSQTADVEIEIIENRDPAFRANPDYFLTEIGAPSVLDVLRNDRLPHSGQAVLISFTQPEKGSLRLSGNTLVFDPGNAFGDPGPVGEVLSFSYTVQIGSETQTTNSQIGVIRNGTRNSAPSGIELVAGGAVSERAPSGTFIAAFGANDPDVRDIHTFQLVDDADGRFSLSGNELRVANSGLLDFESRQSHRIEIDAIDSAGLRVTRHFDIFVKDALEFVHGTAAVDILLGGIGQDHLISGGGNDVLNGGLGADHYELGQGRNRITGTSEQLHQDSVQGFGDDDVIAVKGIAIRDLQLFVEQGADTFELHLPRTQITFNESLQNRGFVAWRTSGEQIELALRDLLPDLKEFSTVEAHKINGIVAPDFLTATNTTRFEVSLRGDAGAAFANSVGYYEIAENGDIRNIQVLAQNAKTALSPVTIEIHPNSKLGFFLAQNGSNIATDRFFDSDQFVFVEKDGHKQLGNAEGTVLNTHLYFSHDQSWNPDGAQHVLSGVNMGDPTSLILGFEDLIRNAHSDDDFQDVIITVDALF